jgi:NADPH:quinone reductase-like Zn-dependent oxidoreductase
VGTYAVQIAKAYGAEVTAVCSTANVAMVKSLRADHVVDYTKEDFSAGGARYEAIFDAVGKCPKPQRAKALAPNGLYLTVAKLNTKQSIEELTVVKELIEAGQVKAVIDRCYPLAEMVEAHRYVEKGHKAGNVVIPVA